MKPETIHYLNEINREFYRITADEFDQTRQQSWPGWNRLLPYLQANGTSPVPTENFTVLDVGCGNGRFGIFLAENLPLHSPIPFPGNGEGAETGAKSGFYIHYQGVDNSPTLLEHARTALTARPNLRFDLENRDIVDNPPDAGEYDLVVLLGVLHHVPGLEQRQNLLRRLAERVKPGGLLVFAAWRFYEYERFRERIVPWPDDLEVEPHDYLLDWRRGETALRYCHYVDDNEHAALVATTGLQEILTYRADGQSGETNRYSLLRK